MRLILLLATLLAFTATDVLASTLSVRRGHSTTDGRGTVVNALAINSNRWTDWISIKDDESIVFSIKLVDADSSITAITMVCETSDRDDTPDDGGYEMHVLSIASGTATSTQLTWSYTTGGSKSWTWTVANIPDDFLNCKFAATGAPAAADLLTVKARGMTP